MKNLLAILFLSWAVTLAAQTYPVISTTTNRTLAITPLAVQLVSSNTAAGVRTLLNVTNATGLEATAANLTTVSNTVTTQGNTLATNVALLNGTNTFTGTNRFTAPVIITNAASTISGNGAGLTNLAAGNIASGSLADARLSANVALLNGTNTFTGTNAFSVAPIGSASSLTNTLHIAGQVPTNIFLASLSTTAAGTLTNNGGWASGTYIAKIRCSAAPTAHAKLCLDAQYYCTNGNTTVGSVYAYVGPNTNFISTGQGWTTTAHARAIISISQTVIQNYGSYTNQIVGTAFSGPPFANGVTNAVDTSVPFDLYLCGATVTSFTNAILTQIKAYWID